MDNAFWYKKWKEKFNFLSALRSYVDTYDAEKKQPFDHYKMKNRRSQFNKELYEKNEYITGGKLNYKNQRIT